MDVETVSENLRAISADFAAERRERQQRRDLVAADFARLRDAGFLLTGVGKRRRVGAADLRNAAHARSWRLLGCPGLRDAPGRAEFLDGDHRGACAF